MSKSKHEYKTKSSHCGLVNLILGKHAYVTSGKGKKNGYGNNRKSSKKNFMKKNKW